MTLEVRRWILAWLTLAVLWLFVRGVTFDPVNVAQELLIGLALGFAVAVGFRRLYPGKTDLVRTARAAPYTALYVAAFLWELVTANVDVAKRVLAPSMPIEPRVIEVPLRVETPFAITTIANSITLTPGTLTMDYDDDTNTLYVHAIEGRDRDSVVAPIRRWEDYALVIFDEERKPGDPVPEHGGEDGE
ncbi:MAG: Na+/H+ antiporter subunit E [Halobacterium sp.]